MKKNNRDKRLDNLTKFVSVVPVKDGEKLVTLSVKVPASVKEKLMAMDVEDRVRLLRDAIERVADGYVWRK